MTRAGRYVTQVEGHRAFEPAPLPPNPELNIDRAMALALDRASRLLGRLDGVSTRMPNPDLFVAMYVRQEAVLSSQIEGTQASLMDVLQFEEEPEEKEERARCRRDGATHSPRRRNHRTLATAAARTGEEKVAAFPH